MNKLFRFILSTGRKRRITVVGIALWLLRQVRDIEEGELWRHSDKLDKIDLEHDKISFREYTTIEEECSNCECALGFIDSAIEDLEYAY
jgi:hypothetical protein